MTSLYKKSGLRELHNVQSATPKVDGAFEKWNEAVFQAGALSLKLKEMIAVACATATGCAYCIDIHTNAAKKQGATKEELAEAIFVASALKAGSAFAHGANAFRTYDGDEGDSLYKKEFFNKTNDFASLAPEVFKTFIAFATEATKEGVLRVKEKELIAVHFYIVTNILLRL